MPRQTSFVFLLVAVMVIFSLGGCGDEPPEPPLIPEAPIQINGDAPEAEEPAEAEDTAEEPEEDTSGEAEDRPQVAGPPANGVEIAPMDDTEAGEGFGSRVFGALRAAAGFFGRMLFLLILPIGIAAALLGMPGGVLVLVNAVVFSAFQGWETPAWWVLLILLVLTVLGESAEHVLSFAGVKQSGATNSTGVWTMVGGLTGAVFGGIIAPLLAGIGALAGPVGWIILSIIPPIGFGMVGGFSGGYLFELRRGKTPEEARTAGLGALFGRLAGSFAKALIVAVMVAIVLISTWGALF